MNQYESARRFYFDRSAEIMATPKNEWAMDAYEWSDRILLTPIEYSIWCEIRMANAVMYPQYPVGRFFVDFGNPVAKVAIECDGRAFHLDKEKDAARQREIERMGWAVYRITGRDCNSDAPEDEDEYGHPIRVPSAAEVFIRRVASAHGLVRNSSKSGDFFGACSDWALLQGDV